MEPSKISINDSVWLHCALLVTNTRGDALRSGPERLDSYKIVFRKYINIHFNPKYIRKYNSISQNMNFFPHTEKNLSFWLSMCNTTWVFYYFLWNGLDSVNMLYINWYNSAKILLLKYYFVCPVFYFVFLLKYEFLKWLSRFPTFNLITW